MFYTYLHRRGDTGAPFYIGKGTRDRAWSRSRRNPHWNNIVAKSGRTVEILAAWPTEAEALEHEKFLIACFRGMGRELCNMTDGGEGTVGHRHTEEARKEMSAARTGRRRRTPVSEEQRRNIGAASRGRVMSAETRARMSAAHKGRVCSEEVRARMRLAQVGARPTPEALEKARQSHFKYIEFGGESLPGVEWAKRLGVNPTTVFRRVARGLAPTGERVSQ